MAEPTFMVVVAVVIGCLGGLGAVAFRALIELVQRTAWRGLPFSIDLVRSHPWWWIVLVPAAGGLIVGPLVYFFAREAKGHGVPEVMEAVALHGGYIRPRLVVVKSLASAITIGTGGSVGREGPIVQIGSALGSTVGQWLNISGQRLRTLAGCGAAAGIAATFNAPVAGALFAVEVILGDFAVAHFSPIVISSVMATVISRYFLGDFPAFEVPPYEMVSAWELLFYLVLGLVAALVAQAFIRSLGLLEDLFDRLPIPPWLRTPLGGAMIGAIALTFPQIMGVGYESIDRALRGEMAFKILLILVVVKMLSTGLTIGSGGSGGVFAPSLFLGAMAGGAVGSVVHDLFPHITASSGAYALVGMGAVVAAATRAPITAILIIFELTSDYKLIVPLMASCIIATLLASRLEPESIYTIKLVRRGVELFRGRDINVLRSLKVSEVMDRDMATVPVTEPLGELLEQVAEHAHAYYYVVDDAGSLRGTISLEELRNAPLEHELPATLVMAGDLARIDIPTVTRNENLDTVMKIFGGKNREELPVVEDGDPGRLLGVVTRRHLIDSYNRELMKRDMVTGLGSSLAATATEEVVLGDDYLMAELEAPGEFLGHTLGQLDVRSRYGVQILLIRRPSTHVGDDALQVVPGPDTVITRGDHLVVVGKATDVTRLRAL